MHPADVLTLFAGIVVVVGLGTLLHWALGSFANEQPWDDAAGVSERNVAGDSRR